MTKKNKQFVPEPDISVFKDREKEAKFWEENFDKVWRQPVKVKFAKNLSTSLNIRLDPVVLGHIRKQARARGLGPTQLIRMWVMERIGRMAWDFLC